VLSGIAYKHRKVQRGPQRVSFLQEDLIVNDAYGLDSFVISFENAIFKWHDIYLYTYQMAWAQVELYYDTGDFDIRWGALWPDKDRFAAGIVDLTRNPPGGHPSCRR
jgi:hypothetical protein